MLKNYRVFIILIVVVIFTQVVFGSIVYFGFCDWASRGQFGDMFGAANAMFSGCALAGAIYTNYLQQKAINEQAGMQEKMQSEISRQSEYALLTAKINAINSVVAIYHSLDINNRDYTDLNGRKRSTRDLVKEKIHELETLIEMNKK